MLTKFILDIKNGCFQRDTPKLYVVYIMINRLSDSWGKNAPS